MRTRPYLSESHSEALQWCWLGSKVVSNLRLLQSPKCIMVISSRICRNLRLASIHHRARILSCWHFAHGGFWESDQLQVAGTIWLGESTRGWSGFRGRCCTSKASCSCWKISGVPSIRNYNDNKMILANKFQFKWSRMVLTRDSYSCLYYCGQG